MIYKEKFTLIDINNTSYSTFAEELSDNFLVFMDSSYNLKVYDTSNFSLLTQIELDNSCGIYYIENEIYIRRHDSDLFLVDINSGDLKLYYASPKISNFKSSVGLIEKDVVIESQSRYENYSCVEKMSRILEVSSLRELHKLKEGHNYGNVINGKILIVNPADDRLQLLDYKHKIIDWDINIGDNISGALLDIGDKILIPLSSSVVAIRKSDGFQAWSNVDMSYFYQYDSHSNLLYGLGGSSFEVINADTGEREIQKELSEDLHVASHLTYYNDGLLYFSGFQDKNIPVFGAVNVIDGSLVFTQEVEMMGEKSFRKGLDRPVVVGNRLYVRDATKTLHVYEREDYTV